MARDRRLDGLGGLCGAAALACTPATPATPSPGPGATPPAPAAPAAPSPTPAAAPAAAGPTPTASPDCVDEPAEPTPPAREQHRRTVPKTPKTFGAITCMADREVWYDDEGRMRTCTVATPVEVSGIPIAAEAYTLFYDDGRPEQTTIARPMTLTTAKGIRVSCAADHVSLARDGALQLCDLAGSTRVGDVPCRGGETISFHPTGELFGATLDADYETPVGTFAAGTSLQWHESGALAGGWLAEPQNIGGLDIRYDFRLYEDGQLAEAELAAETSYQGHTFPERAELKFRPDGTLWAAAYEVDSGFMPHGELWSDTKHVRFDCAGNVLRERIEHHQDESGPEKFR